MKIHVSDTNDCVVLCEGDAWSISWHCASPGAACEQRIQTSRVVSEFKVDVRRAETWPGDHGLTFRAAGIPMWCLSTYLSVGVRGDESVVRQVSKEIGEAFQGYSPKGYPVRLELTSTKVNLQVLSDVSDTLREELTVASFGNEAEFDAFWGPFSEAVRSGKTELGVARGPISRMTFGFSTFPLGNFCVEARTGTDSRLICPARPADLVDAIRIAVGLKVACLDPAGLNRVTSRLGSRRF